MAIYQFLRTYQLDIMLFLSGMCGMLVYLTIFTKSIPPRRKHTLSLLEFMSMLLLICDRFAYIYRGDVSTTGYWMVRICNFMVYFCTLDIECAVTLYLCDLYSNEGGLKVLPKRLKLCMILFGVGVVMLVIAQFTGLYYTFDEQNRYVRAPGNIICYAIPLVIVVLQLSVILQYRKLIRPRLSFALILHLVAPVVASIIQLFAYGISLTNMTVVGMAVYLYICALSDLNQSLERARINEIESYREAQRKEHVMFEQTAEALANAIDAKDQYTSGHSSRVAMYSEMIAREAGLSEEECERVYFAALLHDVGKIGIDDAIINKAGRLTNEEFAQIKLHPVYGNQILSSIRESPYLSVGAHYHHERYDGHGYPDGLAGEDIPELARIIAVADAYDAMTSKRSYRDVRPQHLVREEIVKGMETQFDPQYASIMLHHMDLDLEYRMHEQIEERDGEVETSLQCESLYQVCSTGIRIMDTIVRIHLVCELDEGFDEQEAFPALILFDSLDGLVHESGPLCKDLRYLEYAQVRFDGQTLCGEARNTETTYQRTSTGASRRSDSGLRAKAYDLEAVRYYDHVQIRIFEHGDREQYVQVIVALPFSGKFSYLSLAGQHCHMRDIHLSRDEQTIGEDYIPRIAEEISYIKGCTEGDIPNIQIEGALARATRGIPLSGALRLTFHTQGLPNARLIWHCPYVCIFASQDGKMFGEGYQELFQVRLDGEVLESAAFASVDANPVHRTQDFVSWDAWKEAIKKGMDCVVDIEREGNTITVRTENQGIAIKSIKTIPDETGDVYAALTGDQCTITNIHLQREGGM